MKIIVIGGGIVGASTAYALACEGQEVVLVDANEPGRATDAAAGIICPWLSQRRNQAWYLLAKKGAAFYPSFIQAVEKDSGLSTNYKKQGAISLHTQTKKQSAMLERAIEKRKDAPEIGQLLLLSEEETENIFPFVQKDVCSVFVEGAARVDGQLLRQALWKAFETRGGRIQIGQALLNEQEQVEVDGQLVAADAIIVTAGAWSPFILKKLGIHLAIEPQKAQILRVHTTRETEGWPLVMPLANQYIVPFENGEIAIGATHENDQGFDLRPTVRSIHEILSKATEMAPGLADTEWREVRVGFRPVAPNFLPIFGMIPYTTRCYYANGLGSSGLTVGPFVGFELAAQVLKKPLQVPADWYSGEEAFRKGE